MSKTATQKLPRLAYVTYRDQATGALSLVPGEVFTTAKASYARRDELNKASGEARAPYGWTPYLDNVIVSQEALDAFPYTSPISTAMRRDMAGSVRPADADGMRSKLSPRSQSLVDLVLTSPVHGLPVGPVAQIYVNEERQPRSPQRMALARYLQACLETWAASPFVPNADPTPPPVFEPGAEEPTSAVVIMVLDVDPVALAAGGWQSARYDFESEGNDGWRNYRKEHYAGPLAADISEIIADGFARAMPNGGYEIADLTVNVKKA